MSHWFTWTVSHEFALTGKMPISVDSAKSRRSTSNKTGATFTNQNGRKGTTRNVVMETRRMPRDSPYGYAWGPS